MELETTFKIVLAITVIFLSILNLVFSGKTPRDRIKYIKIRQKFGFKSRKNISANAEVAFIVKCEVSDKEYNAQNLSGLAAMAFERALWGQNPKNIWIWHIQKKASDEFMAREETVNKPRQLISAKFKIIEFKLFSQETIKKKKERKKKQP